MKKTIFLGNLTKIFLRNGACGVTKKNFVKNCQKDGFSHFRGKIRF